MEEVQQKSILDTLREAWENIPLKAKNLVYGEYGHTKQNVADILKKGRKDEQTMVTLLEDIKKATYTVANDIAERNEKIQAL